MAKLPKMKSESDVTIDALSLALKAATSGRLGLKRLSPLRDAQEGLNLFRSLAQDNGIDPETFINSVANPPSDCEQSAQQFNS